MTEFLVMDEYSRLNFILHLDHQELIELAEWVFEFLDFNRYSDSDDIDIFTGWYNVINMIIDLQRTKMREELVL